MSNRKAQSEISGPFGLVVDIHSAHCPESDGDRGGRNSIGESAGDIRIAGERDEGPAMAGGAFDRPVDRSGCRRRMSTPDGGAGGRRWRCAAVRTATVVRRARRLTAAGCRRASIRCRPAVLRTSRASRPPRPEERPPRYRPAQPPGPGSAPCPVRSACRDAAEPSTSGRHVLARACDRAPRSMSSRGPVATAVEWPRQAATIHSVGMTSALRRRPARACHHRKGAVAPRNTSERISASSSAGLGRVTPTVTIPSTFAPAPPAPTIVGTTGENRRAFAPQKSLHRSE
jgi:hypothetical protein